MVAVDTVIIEVWSCTRSRCDIERSVGAMLSTWAASGRKRGRLSGDDRPVAIGRGLPAGYAIL
jgi:hypothetical protein